MSKAVLISIQPKWCELIASGKKTIEVRKTKPKIPTPFKCYIYCTKPKSKNDLGICLEDGKVGLVYKCNYDAAERYDMQILSGKVIGEFVCDDIIPISVYYSNPNCHIALKEFPYTCLMDREIINYLGNGKKGYGWHISDLKIYDKPKELNEFYKPAICDYNEFEQITRPLQSWCYVEEIVSTDCCENFDECAGCCHNTNCGYFDDLLRLGDKKAFEENCVGCCCGDGTLCNKNNGGCSNYEIKPIMG